MGIELICLDADDTLWHNMRYFDQAHEGLFALLREFAESTYARQKLEDAQRRNLQLYGYGVKGYTLSAIETAIEIAEDRLPIATIRDILEAGRSLLSHPVELFPGVIEAVQQLSKRAPIVLVTKGDLIHQEAKIAGSGVGGLMTGIEIVSDKTAAVFDKVFRRYSAESARTLVVGDSVRSDILPALQTGAFAALVPNALSGGPPPARGGRLG